MKIVTVGAIAVALVVAGQVRAEAQAIHKKCQGEFKGQAVACIKTPRDGGTTKSSEVEVSLTSAEMGAAHYHLFLDTNVPAEGQAIPEGPGIAHLQTGAKQHTFSAVPSGLHRLIVVLGDAGHVAIARQRSDTAYFTVPSK